MDADILFATDDFEVEEAVEEGSIFDDFSEDEDDMSLDNDDFDDNDPL